MRLAAIAAAIILALIVSSASASTTVSAVYFVPRDQEATMTASEVNVIMADVRGWYELQVGSTFEVSAARVIKGKHDTAYYGQDAEIWYNVLRELGYWCGTGVHVIVVHPSIAFTGGGACSDGEGTAMIAEGAWDPFEGVVAHELGHAFNLPHPKGCGAVGEPAECFQTVMWAWWGYPDVGLLDGEIEALLASRYFGDDPPKTCKPFKGRGRALGRCR